MDKLCPKLPLAYYATEQLPRTRRRMVHAFLGVVQRDRWVQDGQWRETTAPHASAVWDAWADFSIILHTDSRKRLTL